MTVRELSHNTSAVLERVQRGEIVYVTKFGKVIAVLHPAAFHGATREVLVHNGVVTGPGESGAAALHRLGPPLPAVKGRPTLSEVLEELRDEDDR